MANSTNKATAARLAAVILAACMAAHVATASISSSLGSMNPLSSISSIGIDVVCSAAEYESTCKTTLGNISTGNPKEILKAAFHASITNIENAIKKSSIYKEAAKDERTKDAFVVCDEVLNTTIDDLRRSTDKVDTFDITKIGDYVDDVKVWLSAGLTCRDTCLDAFENTTGDTGEKITELLKDSGELLANGLSILEKVSKLFGGSLTIGSIFNQRRLLREDISQISDTSNGHETPNFVNHVARKLMNQTSGDLTPNAVVAKDGSGEFKTIGDAIDTAPLKSNTTFVILVKAGVYKESVMIPKKCNNVVLIGEGTDKTIITDDKSFTSGYTTFHTSTLTINGEDFMAKDIAIENTAGAEGHQAVAVRVSGDKAVFFNVYMDGYQDTLYSHTYRQFYRDCRISGTIDFIFGNSVSVYQNCILVVRKPMENQACMVTAQGRKDVNSVGITVIQNCSFVGEKELLATDPPVKVYLGRPWKAYSRTIIMNSFIDGLIAPEGWSVWMGEFGLDTCYYGEYDNRGPGSDLSKRVTWKGIKKMTPKLAQSFTAEKVFAGDEWLKNTGIPYVGGMMEIPK